MRAEEIRDGTERVLSDVKPRLLIDNANPDRTVADLRNILAQEGEFYDRGTPVRVTCDATKGIVVARPLTPDSLVLHAHTLCRPFAVKTDRDGSSREVDVRLPAHVARMYLDWFGEWRLPALNGIACAPLLRENGSIHAVNGYDPASGNWCERIPEIERLIPAVPTMDDAARALRTLRTILRTFCFADALMTFDAAAGVEVVDITLPPGQDESAALAALMTAVCRPSLPLAPGVVIRAAAMSGAGTGKGLFVRCISLIAYGNEPHAVSGGVNREELEKKIAAELMEAGPMLFLDNLNGRTFNSELLASVLTERPARVRILGRSQMVPLNSSAWVALTGNGLSLTEDLARRFLVIELDARTEDPEARPFRINIKAICHERREELLAAALTIWRWGRLSKHCSQGRPFGSFETWTSWVRDPLLALGCQDPVARIGETKSRDTERQQVIQAFEVWWSERGSEPVAARDLSDDVRTALNLQKRSRQFIASTLDALSGTRMGGYVLTRQKPSSKWSVIKYALERTSWHHEHADDPDATQAPGSSPYDPYAPYAFPDRQQFSDTTANGTWDLEGAPHRGRTDGTATANSVYKVQMHRGHRGHRDEVDPGASGVSININPLASANLVGTSDEPEPT
ncbi:hypothetical protein L1787_18145 [Acuticoccus sp. M5D2P5]|uniref:hypothetical protein n=1 Tax=Acuticoccus kalidii TaxID=2910977 RepID=UPI001F344EBB|nr:hypothetical protein [Acuticoccus kalidii]MCF3935319.1 hypothetical protein [Acuticoccus kalidii]